jgi:hypothetical protein
MKYVELSRKENFDSWNTMDLAELHQLQTCEDFNEYRIYQSKNVKIGLIILESYERTPFRLMKNSFKLVSLSGGEAITRFSDGRISLMMFEKGECVSQNVVVPPMINDLQNIGDNLLVMALIEYKNTLSQDSGLYPSLQMETPVLSGI